jgi:ribosomal protein L3 glutamine methyltransferase
VQRVRTRWGFYRLAPVAPRGDVVNRSGKFDSSGIRKRQDLTPCRAVDLSKDALEVAARNVADYGLADRVERVESDMFAALKGRTYDVIVSNPPYVNAESVAALPPEYQAEPALALGSGEDGLDATRQILAQAKTHLNPGGLLVVEIGHNRDALEAAFPALPFTWLDTAGGDQFVFMLRREDL